MTRLASITQDIADLMRTLRNPQHPTGADDNFAADLAALRKEMSALLTPSEIRALAARGQIRTRDWLARGWRVDLTRTAHIAHHRLED